MRPLPAVAALLILAPALAGAVPRAFVLGTSNYDYVPDLPNGTESVDAVDGLQALGFEVSAIEDGRPDRVDRFLADLVSDAPESERLLVVLTGRFITDGDRTWYLTRGAREPAYLRLDERAVPLDQVMRAMARSPSPSVLVLGRDPSVNAEIDPFLRNGLGRIAPPRGVAVLTGSLRDVANLMADELSVRGQPLARLLAGSPEIAVTGALPPSFMLAPGRGQPEPGGEAEEEALWEGAVALGTEEGFVRYLDTYPRGRYAAQASAALAEIRAEPNRDARLSEEALALTRDQRREIQRNLTLLDFDPRGIDGVFGSGTRRAITDWQQQNGFAQTSYLDREQIERLAAQAARRAQQIEAEAERTRAAEARADAAYWEETGARGDEAGFRAYLSRYPDGARARQAQEALRQIEADKRRAAQGEDRAAWDRARGADSVGAYQLYLERFPEGLFRDEAQARRDELLRADRAGAAEAQARAGEEALGLNTLTARVIEQRLDVLGLNPGRVDGTFDGDTRRALRGYQRDRGLDATGYLDEQTLVRLLADTLGRALQEQ